jgi:hypothetical protein
VVSDWAGPAPEPSDTVAPGFGAEVVAAGRVAKVDEPVT